MNKHLPYDETVQCVQCGYCLPACPTYMTMRKETHSPRGRIHLVKMAAEGKLALDELAEPIQMCLGCRACETACPSGVQYGKILEETREVLHEYREGRTVKPVKWMRDTLFRLVFPEPKRLQRAADLIWSYQSSGLQRLAHKGKLNRILPEHLSAFEEVLPEVTSPLQRRQRPRVFKPYDGKNQPKWKVAFFTGCVMDAMFERINRLSMELLALGGCEVHVIEQQTCCGALHVHAGRRDDARELAKRNISAFEQLDADFIVNNAGGCGAMLVEYGELLAGDREWEERAKAFAAKTRDISQILDQCELPLDRPVNEVVTYQRSCHMTHVQKVEREPLSLIGKIPGVMFREMANPLLCCGSAGIYNIVNYEESMEILDKKMDTVKQTEATTIVTTNPGCLLQVKLGVKRAGLWGRVRTVHLVELLAESAGITGAGQ